MYSRLEVTYSIGYEGKHLGGSIKGFHLQVQPFDSFLKGRVLLAPVTLSARSSLLLESVLLILAINFHFTVKGS